MNVIISKRSRRAKICFLSCNTCRVTECCRVKEHSDLLTPTIISTVVIWSNYQWNTYWTKRKAAVRISSANVDTLSRAQPTFYSIGTENSLQEVQRLGREADHSLPFSPEVKNEVLYLTSLMFFHDIYGNNFSVRF